MLFVLPGVVKIPPKSTFEEGVGFDASSLRGWASINESDMLLIPDPSRFWVDPFFEEPTLCLFANVVDPLTKEGYGLDPRAIAHEHGTCGIGLQVRSHAAPGMAL